MRNPWSVPYRGGYAEILAACSDIDRARSELDADGFYEAERAAALGISPA